MFDRFTYSDFLEWVHAYQTEIVIVTALMGVAVCCIIYLKRINKDVINRIEDEETWMN